MSIRKQTIETLPVIKFMMVLSSLAPFWILCGITGLGNLVSDRVLWAIVSILLIFPPAVLLLRIYVAKQREDEFSLNTTHYKKLNSESLFTYLFIIFLPVHWGPIVDIKDLIAVLVTILFGIIIFWNQNLYVHNLWFTISGYHMYTLPEHDSIILLSPRRCLSDDLDTIIAYRLSNTIFIEKGVSEKNG